MSLPTLITFIAYLLALLVIGVYAYRATGDIADYLLGGRKLAAPVAALSAGASDMSGWLLLGLPGAIYVGGLSQAWIIVGLLVGALLNWVYVARPLRICTSVHADALTLPDYFEFRFGDTSRALRTVSALAILLFFTFYTASGLVAGAKLFASSFDLSYAAALWIGAAVIVSYTLVGGFLAVSWTDFLQALMMLFALVVAPIAVIYELGGPGAAVDAVNAVHPEMMNPFAGMTFIGFLSLVAWGLGYCGQPHILARFMAISDPDHMGRAATIGMSWMLVTLIASVAVGLFGVGYFAEFHPEVMSPQNSEKVFIELTQIIFNPWIAGMLLAGILAAIMSTIDSQLLVLSASLTQDLYRGLLRRGASEAELLWMGRLTLLGIAFAALGIASDPESRVLDLVSYAWGGLGASFGPIVVISLYWRRMTRNGAIAGIVTGATTVVVWHQLSGGLFDLYELLPAFVFASIAIVVVSLLGGEPEKQVVEHFDSTRPLYKTL